MNIDQKYQEILQELKNNQRPIVNFTKVELNDFKNIWEESLSNNFIDKIRKILCIVDHTKLLNNQNLDEQIVKTLKIDNPEVRIFALACSQRQIIEKMQLEGVSKAPTPLINALNLILETNSDQEVLEWILRTVERLGPRFDHPLRKTLLTKEVGFFSLPTKQNKTLRELYKLLKSRWHV